MAHIKCRYNHYWCGQYKHKPNDYCNDCHKDGAAFCGDYIPTGTHGYDPCLHIEHDSREFEKDVKSYELILDDKILMNPDGSLTIRGRFIEQSDIEYLEIDGRILINEKGEKND